MRAGKALVVAVVAALFVGLSAVGAAAATETVHRGTETFADYLPCVSEFPSLEAHELTIIFNGVERHSESNGGEHAGFHLTGTASAVPVLLADENDDGEPDFNEETGSFVVAGPREGESFTGKFTIRGTFNRTPSDTFTDTFTFSGHATGDEGTRVRWNDNAHFTSQGEPNFDDPTDTIKVAFEKSRCH